MSEDKTESRRLTKLGELRLGVKDYSHIYGYIFGQIGFPKGRVLDIGSADGRLNDWLKTEKQTGEVVSFDIRKFDKIPDFVRGVARALPFKDGAFPTVVSIGAVTLASGLDPEYEDEYYRELLRVTQQKAILFPASSGLLEYIKTIPAVDYKSYPLFPGIQDPVGNLSFAVLSKKQEKFI